MVVLDRTVDFLAWAAWAADEHFTSRPIETVAAEDSISATQKAYLLSFSDKVAEGWEAKMIRLPISRVLLDPAAEAALLGTGTVIITGLVDLQRQR